MIWLKIVLVIWFLFVVYQDFKHRSISWLLFPVGIGIAIIYGLQNTEPIQLMKNTMLNYLFLTVQILMVVVYFLFLRKMKPGQLKEYLGMGDVLFLLIMGLLLSPLNFIFYLIVSFLLILTGYTIYFIIRGSIEYKKQIPLAGLMSVFFLFFILTEEIFKIDIFSDYWILKLMNHAG